MIRQYYASLMSAGAGYRNGHDFSLSHYVDAGKVASFCNSGTRSLANCIRVFEFDDYSDRDYSETSPPRALLIAKIDLTPGTQARPPFPHISAAACVSSTAPLTQGPGPGRRGGGGGAGGGARCLIYYNASGTDVDQDRLAGPAHGRPGLSGVQTARRARPSEAQTAATRFPPCAEEITLRPAAAPAPTARVLAAPAPGPSSCEGGSDKSTSSGSPWPPCISSTA